MKQLLTIKGMFNDELTGYKDKMCSMSMVVDIEKDCKCWKGDKCIICKLVEQGKLTDIKEKDL